MTKNFRRSFFIVGFYFPDFNFNTINCDCHILFAFILIGSFYVKHNYIHQVTLSFFNLDARTPVFRVSDYVLHKGVVHPQKMATGWKFWIYKEVGMYYLCRENKSFVFAYAKSRFSHDAAHLLLKQLIDVINIMTKK